MILVTGAGGKTGQAIIKKLVRSNIPIRALIHRVEQVPLLREIGANDVICGDMYSEHILTQACSGVEAIYHIPPNMCQNETLLAEKLLHAARAASVNHFVYHSVLHPQIEDMPHHWNKLHVEEILFTRDIPYTILQPAAYMQNILAYWKKILDQGIYAVPYPAQTRLGMVDLEDVAEAASIVLKQTGHEGAIYELTGCEVLTQDQVAEIIGKAIGRSVRCLTITSDQWREDASKSGMQPYAIDTLLKMFEYYAHYGFWGNSNVITWLLGRPPGRFGAFIQRVLENHI